MAKAPEKVWTLIPTAQRADGSWIDDTLRARVHERRLAGKLPLAGSFPRQRVEVIAGASPDDTLQALYYARGWTDGLPVVAPTLERVSAMLRYSPLGADRSLGELEPLRGVATIEKVAANAVMAGCLPEYFPVVLAAVDALLDPAFNLRGVQTTDESVTPLLVVNGPVGRMLDVNSRSGALGPGWRANATIGRAVRLVMQNLGGGWPAAVSFTGLGQPARYALCVAENEAESPWEPLHAEQGLSPDSSAVTLLRAETVVNVTGGLGEIASVMGSSASAFSILWSGRSTVILSPSLATSLATEGWSKEAVRAWLYEQGRWPVEQWRSSWLNRQVGGEDRWPAWVRAAAEQGAVPAVRSPADLVLVVAGSTVPIPQHAYCPSWGFPPACVTRPVVYPPGVEAFPASPPQPDGEPRGAP